MIIIEKVTSKRDFNAFAAFPASLNQRDPQWVPPLLVERREHFSNKNPGTDHIEWQAWTAKVDGVIVGRITAQIDSLYGTCHEDKVGHFGTLDAIDDPDVFAALTSTAEKWLAERGIEKATGPFSLNINQESGLLVEGFNTPPSIMMAHNGPYYADRLQQLGYVPAIDLFAYWIQLSKLHFPKSLLKLMSAVRPKVTIRYLDRKRFDEEVQVLRQIFNSAWQKNWGFIPFTEREFAAMGSQMKYLVPTEMICIAEMDAVPVGFIIGLPNINEAISDLNGKLLPFGWAKLLWRLKVSGPGTARVPLMGVSYEHQFSRVGPVIALLLIEALRASFCRNKIHGVEMSWILESNAAMRNILQKIGAEPYKRYRLYEKTLGTNGLPQQAISECDDRRGC